MRPIRALLFVLLCCLLSTQLIAQEVKKEVPDSTSKKRLRTVLVTTSGLYVTSMAGLYHLWYKDTERSSFHFFNDNREWQQIDKVGHFYTAFHISQLGTEVFTWTGIDRKKAILYGGLSGMIFQTPIEILDGFSSKWGASWGDLIANTAGSGLAMGQYYLWDEIRIQPKFSFRRTELAEQRPSALGNGLHEELIKDYNGQTYWLSFDMYSLTGKHEKIPKWLNLALGYGAHNMIYAHKEDNIAHGLTPYRQYFLSLDLDLSHIKTRYKAVNTALRFINIVKFPMPALEYNSENGLTFHPIYF